MITSCWHELLSFVEKTWIELLQSNRSRWSSILENFAMLCNMPLDSIVKAHCTGTCFCVDIITEGDPIVGNYIEHKLVCVRIYVVNEPFRTTCPNWSGVTAEMPSLPDLHPDLKTRDCKTWRCFNPRHVLQAVLDGAAALFCTPACEKKYCMRSSNRLIRKELFKHERGVCQKCGLDCHNLIRDLR